LAQGLNHARARPAVIGAIKYSFSDVGGLPAGFEQGYAQFGPPTNIQIMWSKQPFG
jgi:hypothetical protein